MKMSAVTVTILIVAAIVFLVWASASIKSGVYVNAFCKERGATQKVVYLTFDDGPDAENTPAVLDVLRKKGARATFFLIGGKVPGNGDIIRRLKAEGHAIGCHSYSHANTYPLYSRKKMVKDAQLCLDAIEEAAGEKTDLYRPPFGVTNPMVAACVKKMGFKTVGWNIRTYDTVTDDDDVVLGRIRTLLEPGSVILMHDRLPNAGELLEKVLDLLDAEGYSYDKPLPIR